MKPPVVKKSTSANNSIAEFPFARVPPRQQC
jgi:hypothetical protein